MVLPVHAISCPADPTEAPTGINQHWTNTLTGDQWLSRGTSAVGDWVKLEVGDEKAKVSANDTTAGFLLDKIVPGANVAIDEINDGGNETLRISVTSNIKSWVFQGGNSSVGANSNKIASYGHNNAIGGLPMLRDGNIIGLAAGLDQQGLGGSISIQILKNSAVQAQEIVLDGNVGVDGELVDRYRGALVFATPIAYVAGDVIELNTSTIGYSPTGSDTTIAAFMEDG